MLLKTKNGYWFEIDDEDCILVSQFNWYVLKRSERRLYVVTHIVRYGKRTFQSLHRLVMKAEKGTQLDHINGNCLDNRKSNLRFCTNSQNQANKSKFSTNTSGYKGVSWNKYHQKWEVQITKDGKRIYPGYFDSAKEAALAYNRVAVEHFGEFARINPI